MHINTMNAGHSIGKYLQDRDNIQLSNMFIQNALRNSLQIPYTPLNEYSLLEEEELIAVNELLQILLFPASTLPFTKCWW